HGVELQLHLDDSLPAIQADSDQLGQVVLNLLVNAQHAVDGRSSGRRVTVTTTFSGSSVHLSVADNGAGVPDDARKRIFEPFYTTKASGTGLGLSMSRAIARAHGGELTLSRTDSTGARFDMSLPLAPVLRPAGATGAQQSLPSDPPPGGAVEQRRRVLVV